MKQLAIAPFSGSFVKPGAQPQNTYGKIDGEWFFRVSFWRVKSDWLFANHLLSGQI